MLSSVRAFLEGIIDYAGLFPPAQLPLDQALANYLRYRQEPDSWMLGRFICPAARLKELGAFRDHIAGSGPLRLAVLGRGDDDLSEGLNDIADAARLLNNNAMLVAEAYEMKVPADLPVSGSAFGFRMGLVANFIDAVSALCEGVPNTGTPAPFFESPWTDEQAVNEFAWGLRQNLGHHRHQPGWKLRCGGLEPAAVPTVQQVARVLAECARAGIPWKATAGLHHPLRHFDDKLQTSMHGFINVFGAAILAHAQKIGAGQIEEMLADEDASHFVFDEVGFSWKGHQATTEAIRAARSVVTSFGSCSFDEPRDDLRRLGWI